MQPEKNTFHPRVLAGGKVKNQKGEKEKNTFLNGKVHAVWNFSVANIVEKVVKSRFSLVYHNFSP